MSLAEFAQQFKVLHERWGYRYPGGDHSAYEDKTHQGLNEFQKLTDYFMRFLEQGAYVAPVDVRRMFIDYDFYVEGSAFNLTDDIFVTYLKECGFTTTLRQTELYAEKRTSTLQVMSTFKHEMPTTSVPTVDEGHS